MSYDLWHERQAAAEPTTNESLYPWHETALRILPSLSGQRVLEIGCGRGDFAIALARKNPSAKITAVDFSESAIHIAQKKRTAADVDVLFEIGDATNISQPSGSFDWVISCECLEHIPEPQAMADEVARLLTPGGHFLVTTENYFNGMLLAWLKSWLTGAAFDSGSGVQEHENFFVFWMVRRLFRRAGLHVTREESNHFQWLLLPHCSPANLCTREFKNRAVARVFRPFGRHYTFLGDKLASESQQTR